MPKLIFGAIIKDLADLEACCQLWRVSGAMDATTVEFEAAQAVEIVAKMQENDDGQVVITFSKITD